MADITTPTWEQRLGVKTLPVPADETPATNEKIKLVYETILGVTPTAEQMMRYDGLTVRDLYDDVAQQKEALANSAPAPELTALSKDLYNRPQGENDEAVILAFNNWVGRSPSFDELKLYGGLDQGAALPMIKELGDKEKEEANNPPAYPFFSGNNYVVRFTDDPTSEAATGTDTLWLFDTKDHNLNGKNYSGTMIPFASEDAFNNFFDGKYTLKEANDLGKIVTVGTEALNNPESPFNNARIVKSVNGINPQGDMNLEEAIRWRHGQDIDTDKEQRAKNLLYMVFNDIVQDDPNFSQEYFDNAFNDKVYLAKYINALAYGGYGVPDIYMDIVAHNKRAEGDPLFADYKGISSTKNVYDWRASSPDYQFLADKSTPIELPNMTGKNWDWKALDMPIWDMPKKAYDLAVSEREIDITDPETKAKIEKVQTLLSDVAIQMSEADNRRDLAAAQYNWEKLKGDIEKSLGIKLEDNAYDAWNQLEQMKTNMSSRGVLNSGIMNKAMDYMLRDRRRANQRFREASHDQKDSQLRTYLLNNGSLQEIENFINDRGIDTAKEWGLIPDDETMEYFNLENMKKMYPGVDEAELQEIIDMTIGKTSGGQAVYQSTLMRNHLANLRQLKIDKFQEQTNIYLENKLYEEEQAKKQFTEGDPFSTISYPEAAAVKATDKAGADREAFLSGWNPQKISGEIALKNIFDREIAAGRDPEKAIARTTSNDIYVRNLEAERKLIGEWMNKEGITPKTESDWKKFRDFVYTTRPKFEAENRPDTKLVTLPQTNLVAASSAAKKLSQPEPIPKDYGMSTKITTPQTSGFKAASTASTEPIGSDSRFWSSNPASEENWRKLRSGELKLNY